MGAGKKDPAGLKLAAHDEAEGKSETGRAIFKEICDTANSKGKHKELYQLNVGRILSGERRVTRDRLEKVMTIADTPADEKEKIWERYFGEPPTSIAEVVRRQIIRTGGVREYAKKVDLSHQTLAWILNNRAATSESLFKLITHGEGLAFPWKGDALETKWRHEFEDYHMRKFKSNLLAARIESLFETRPKASRSEWVERGNMPASLSHMSKNRIRILLSALRHGEPTDWQSVDRVLFGMKCTLLERVEVAHAWLLAMQNPPPARKKREQNDSKDDARDRKKRELSDEPLPQNQEAYPAELAEKSNLAIIRTLLEELESSEKKDRALVNKVSKAIEAVAAMPMPEPMEEEAEEETAEEEEETAEEEEETAEEETAEEEEETAEEETAEAEEEEETAEEETAEEEEETAEEETAEEETAEEETAEEETAEAEEEEETAEEETAEVEEEVETEEEEDEDDDVVDVESDEEVDLADASNFEKSHDIWRMAEYLHNFSGEKFAGYTVASGAHAMVADEVVRRAPLGINDLASAIKLVAYCFPMGAQGREKILAVIREAVESADKKPKSLLPKTLAELVKEPRLKHYLIRLRDAGDEEFVSIFRDLIDFSSLTDDPKIRKILRTTSEVSRDFAPAEEPVKKADTQKTAKKKSQAKKSSAEKSKKGLVNDASELPPYGQDEDEEEEDPSKPQSLRELLDTTGVDMRELEKLSAVKKGTLAKILSGEEHCPKSFLRILIGCAAELPQKNQPKNVRLAADTENPTPKKSETPSDAFPGDPDQLITDDEAVVLSRMVQCNVTIEELFAHLNTLPSRVGNPIRFKVLEGTVNGEKSCKRKSLNKLVTEIEELARKKLSH